MYINFLLFPFDDTSVLLCLLLRLPIRLHFIYLSVGVSSPGHGVGIRGRDAFLVNGRFAVFRGVVVPWVLCRNQHPPLLFGILSWKSYSFFYRSS